MKDRQNDSGTSRLSNLVQSLRSIAVFCWSGVWRSQKNTFGIRVLKTVNLSVRAFFNTDLQQKAQALTYVTVLALVPALALMLAVARGFGMGTLLTEEIYKAFPSQRHSISTALNFVDSYLGEASQGVFVGVGIVVLLWTVISLLSNIEDTFNHIWGISRNRSLWRKITDYTAICILIPIMMICSSGISIFVSTSLQSVDGLEILTPFVSRLFDTLPFVLSCAAFILAFQLFPNTRVKLKYSAISGVLCGISFQILQFLFVSGQVYVSKYNAIYGSFAFLPLLLIWLQLSWLILLFGCQLTFAAQNIFHYYFLDDISGVSPRNMRHLAMVVMTVIVQRASRRLTPLSGSDIARLYNLPVRPVSRIVDRLLKAGLIYKVELEGSDATGLTPNVDTSEFTVADFARSWDRQGRTLFIPHFDTLYADLLRHADAFDLNGAAGQSETPLADIRIPEPAEVAEVNAAG